MAGAWLSRARFAARADRWASARRPCRRRGPRPPIRRGGPLEERGGPSRVIIAIDGPAGSGKTTIGRILAEEMGFALVDTGLFYRASTVVARRRSSAPPDESRLSRSAH